jgi:hypothetical protein
VVVDTVFGFRWAVGVTTVTHARARRRRAPRASRLAPPTCRLLRCCEHGGRGTVAARSRLWWWLCAVQFCGINAVFYYSTSFFEGIIPNPAQGTTAVAFVNVVATWGRAAPDGGPPTVTRE